MKSRCCRVLFCGCLAAGTLRAGVADASSSMPAAYLLAQTPTQPEPSTKAVEAAGEDVGGEDPIVLTTRLTPEKSSIGDLLRLEITAAYPAGYSVNFPSHTRIDPMHVACPATSLHHRQDGMRP